MTKRIVYCIPGTYKAGGIERVLTGKANYFCQRGYEVFIITTDQGEKKSFFPLDDRVTCYDLGINYEEDNRFSRFKRILIKKEKQREHKKRLSALLHQLRADIVVSMFFQEAEFLPSIKDGSKKILELHSSKFTKVLMYPRERKLLRLYGRIRMWKEENIAALYDKFVILANSEAKLWHNLSNVTVIPNKIDVSTSRQTTYEEKVVIAVGRFEYQKNFTELIDIWATLGEKYSEWKLKIVGDGYLRTQFSEQIKQKRLENRVSLEPSSEDIFAHYQTSSIYAMTSHYEGLPMVLLEAQSVGLPIVSYRCPSGPEDIVKDGVSGFLVPPGDKKVFAEKLKTLMNDKTLRETMGKAGKEDLAHFSTETVMNKWEHLFDTL